MAHFVYESPVYPMTPFWPVQVPIFAPKTGRDIRVLAAFGLLFGTACGTRAGTPGDSLIADFRFADSPRELAGKNATLDLTNARFTPSGLRLDRGYENAGDGYRATVDIPELNCRSSTFVFEFLPLDFSAGPEKQPKIWRRATGLIQQLFRLPYYSRDHRNLITAGQSYRWLGFDHGNGHLELTLNNQEFRHGFTNVILKTGAWHRLACAFDLAQHRITVMLDGRSLEPVILPANFQLEVVPHAAEASERQLTFANYSNGEAFHGYVGGLQVFNRALSESELMALEPPQFPPRPPIDRGLRLLVILVVTFVSSVAAIWRWRWKVGREKSMPQ